MQKTDFKQLALNIVNRGGTTNYAAPLAHDAPLDYDGIYKTIRHPLHPAEFAYPHGPLILESYGEDLPQEIIDAQHQSFRDAIRHFMPYSEVTRHLCIFMQSDIAHNVTFKNIRMLNINSLPARGAEIGPQGKSRLDNSLSYQFDHPSHKSTYRNYFTAKEIDDVHYICTKHPAIILTVSAFQAGCIDYLENLQNAFARSDTLANDDKSRARTIINRLKEQWSSPNFASEIIPFIALAYSQRDQTMLGPMQGEDFQNGYSLGLRMGLFRHDIKSPLPEEHSRSGIRKFACPARVAISSILARDWNSSENTNNTNGAMLSLIYKQLLKTGMIAPPPVLAAPENSALQK